MKVFDQERVNAVESFISDYIKETGTAPSLSEIARACNISQSRTVSRVVSYLEEQGRLAIETKKGKRTIAIPSNLGKGASIRASILGSCPCGEPMFAIENIEATVSLPVEIFGNGEHFLLHAKGKSMIQRGIFDGDLMVVRKTKTANVGDVVIARVNDDDATAKILARSRGKYYLKPANDSLDEFGERIYKDIHPDGDWEIMGIVDNVIHKPLREV